MRFLRNADDVSIVYFYLSLISSIIRVLESIIRGMVYMYRLNDSSMGRFEAGFSAFYGFIHLKCVY